MGDTEGDSTVNNHEIQNGSSSDAAHTRAGDVISIESERVERMALRVHEALRQALPTDKQVRAELRQVIAELTALEARVAEWTELHHLLHELLVALAPLHAQLILLENEELDTAKLQALLRQWRLCQEKTDALADFGEDIVHIGRPLRREGRELHGERWAVDIVAIQLLFEGTLKEDHPSPESLLERTDEFNGLCHRYLALANRELRMAVDRLQRLSTRLLGGT
jgi:hypothetical protein